MPDSWLVLVNFKIKALQLRSHILKFFGYNFTLFLILKYGCNLITYVLTFFFFQKCWICLLKILLNYVLILNLKVNSLQTFAIPGSIFLSILSGFLYPFPLALFLVCLVSILNQIGKLKKQF